MMMNPFSLIEPYVKGFDTSAFSDPDNTPDTTEAALLLLWSAAAPLGSWAALVAGKLAEDKGRAVAHSLVNSGRTLLRTITRATLTGVDHVGKWLQAMKAAIAPLHQATTLATAGTTAPPKGLMDHVNTAIKGQFQYLDRFGKQVVNKVQTIGAGAVARAGLYADAAWGVAQNAWRRFKMRLKPQERRILGMADHCPDCVFEANRGWQRAGTLRAIGDSICMVLCRCHFIYR